eukprot:TRINITY_DN10950_c0_g1_i1.p1 TRINITY_DN10950_c0_g1~~TRINITY_DN10950_c0_g1_i1.p1  ORF type:complete len:313 (-),score=33.78 TRINITY_DN10950_c0_g1_i1:62-1000(-)
MYQHYHSQPSSFDHDLPRGSMERISQWSQQITSLSAMEKLHHSSPNHIYQIGSLASSILNELKTVSSFENAETLNSLPRDRKRIVRGQTDCSLKRVCHCCGTSKTPEWRRGPDGPKTLCNACGLKRSKRAKQETSRQVKVSLSASSPAVYSSYSSNIKLEDQFNAEDFVDSNRRKNSLHDLPTALTKSNPYLISPSTGEPFQSSGCITPPNEMSISSSPVNIKSSPEYTYKCNYQEQPNSVSRTPSESPYLSVPRELYTESYYENQPQPYCGPHSGVNPDQQNIYESWQQTPFGQYNSSNTPLMFTLDDSFF